MAPKTLAALNVPVGKRLRQLAASLDRLAAHGFHVRPALRGGEHSGRLRRGGRGRQGRAALRGAWSASPTGRRRRSPPTSPTVNLNPTWTVPLSILKKDIITKMRKDPGYVGRMHMRVLDGAGRRGRSQAGRLAFRPRAQFHHPAGFRRLERARRGAHRHAQSAFRLHARHQSQGILQRGLSLPVLGLHARRRPARSRDLAAGGQSRAGAAARSMPRIAKGERTDVRLTHKVPVAWIYLTGWVTRDDVDPLPRRRLRPRREADIGGRCPPAGRERGARLGLRAAIGRRPAGRGQAGVIPRQPVRDIERRRSACGDHC